MKIDLYTAAEALKTFRQMKDQKFNDGSLALKIFDTVDYLTRKAAFLEEEIGKIIKECNAQPIDPDNEDYRLVVKDAEGLVDDEETRKFMDSVITIRKTEIILDLEPFTMDEIEKIMKVCSMSPSELGQISFLIDRTPKQEEAENIIALE